METLVAGFWKRTLHFTERLIVCISVFFFLIMVVSVALIAWAIHETGSFSYVDTLVTEMSITFRDIIGVAIVKALVENVFKYNSFGGRVVSRSGGDDSGAFAVVEEMEIPDDDTYAESEG